MSDPAHNLWELAIALAAHSLARHTVEKGTKEIVRLRAALADIAARAEHECEVAKRAGEKQGNYLEIARIARRALKE